MVVLPSAPQEGGIDVVVGTAGGAEAGALLKEALGGEAHAPVPATTV